MLTVQETSPFKTKLEKIKIKKNKLGLSSNLAKHLLEKKSSERRKTLNSV